MDWGQATIWLDTDVYLVRCFNGTILAFVLLWIPMGFLREAPLLFIYLSFLFAYPVFYSHKIFTHPPMPCGNPVLFRA